MLVLTPDVANKVRGLTVPGHALAPALLTNGNFILPEAVLTDPNHRTHRRFLTLNCSRVDDAIVRPKPDPNTPPGNPEVTPLAVIPYVETDPTLTLKYAYDSSWLPGEIVVVE